MRPLHLALLVASVILTIAVLGVQIWLHEQQLERQRVEFARYQADMARWQAQMQARPGLPLVSPPMLPPPPMVIPLLPVFTPVLMLPFMLVALAEYQRVQKQQHDEEENRTPYTEEDLMENWEFKIIRSAGQFEKPAFLARILQEEALAGWRMVEKFDAARVRLKRLAGQPTNASELPAGYDPYRTVIKHRIKWHHVLWFFCIVCLVLIPAFSLLRVFDPISLPAFAALLTPVVVGAIAFALLAVWQAAKYKRASVD